MAGLAARRLFNDDDVDEDDLTGFESPGFGEDDQTGFDEKDQTGFESPGSDDTIKCTSPLSFEEIPKVGMKFETEKDAHAFYLAYSKKMGFGIKWHKFHDDDSGNRVDRTFACCAEGKRGKDKRNKNVKQPRPETRFNCKAKLKIIIGGDGKFHVDEFVENHTHGMVSPNKVHMFRCHRNISSTSAMRIEMASGVGIRPKASYDLMAKEAGGRENLGFIPVDYRNYLRSKRTREAMTGDTGGVLEYLHTKQFKDPNFFYAIQVDEDDLLTNIFWADAKMRADYKNFGDVVCFDTTYRKNNEGRPIAIFVGVNHHKQTTVFGVALLYDETSPTFEWLFDTFAEAMWDTKPTTILTDQDPAMAKALSLRWPETNHRLCIWHIYQNAATHLSSAFSEFKEFSKDFSSCIYDFEEETDFFEAWNEMLKNYGLEDNDWLARLFEKKEKWALVYGRQMFCADMTTTQRSESMNSVVKRYVTYQHKFLDFFNHFERLIEDRRYEELKADFMMKTSIPSLPFPLDILKHAARVYTPDVFEWFRKEWYKSHSSTLLILEQMGSITKYEITPYKKNFHHTVTYDSSSGEVECSCRKFEFAGILCSHVLKAFSLTNVAEIPSQYILKRWTREAKHGFSCGETTAANTKNLDPKVCQQIRYKELCGLYFQLVTKAAESEDTYNIAKDGVLKMLADIDVKLRDSKSIGQKTGGKSPVEETVQHSSVNEVENEDGGENTLAVKGIKMKKKPMGGKRYKSALEKAIKKKRSPSKTRQKSKKSKASAIDTTMPLINKGGETQFQDSSVLFRNSYQAASQVEVNTNQIGQVNTSVDSFSMNQFHQPRYFTQTYDPAVLTNLSEHSFLQSTPTMLHLRDSNMGQVEGINKMMMFGSQQSSGEGINKRMMLGSQLSSVEGISERMMFGSQQSTTFSSNLNSQTETEICRCPIPCPGGMVCKYRIRR